jgi:hypothetical protein
MREVIYVGLKDFVLENRETGLKHFRTMFDEMGFIYLVESVDGPVNFARVSPS